MADRNGKSGYDDVLDQARDLIRDADSAGEEFSLEEILAEYGGGTERQLLRDAEAVPEEPEAEKAQEDTVPLPDLKPVRQERPAPPKREPSPPPKKEPEVPPPPRPLSMEEMVGRTVGEVMEEQAALSEKPRRRGLFSRRPMEDTEELPPPETISDVEII